MSGGMSRPADQEEEDTIQRTRERWTAYLKGHGDASTRAIARTCTSSGRNRPMTPPSVGVANVYQDAKPSNDKVGFLGGEEKDTL